MSVVLVMQIASIGYEDPKWAWWLVDAFVHEVGIGSVIF